MNQKITLRFADHVLTFVLTAKEATEAEQGMRRKWIHHFTRGDGDFIVNFSQVLWMKISPTGDAETGSKIVEQEVEEEYRTLFGTPGDDTEVECEAAQEVVSTLFAASSFWPSNLPRPSDGGEHGSL